MLVKIENKARRQDVKENKHMMRLPNSKCSFPDRKFRVVLTQMQFFQPSGS